MTITTFSIVAFCPEENSWGIAVASRFLAVGSMVPYAKATIGAVATQAAANLQYGELALTLMERGKSAQETINILINDDPGRDERQVGLVDGNGQAATYTGKLCSPWAGGITGKHYAIQGNVLTGENTVKAMAYTYEKSKGEFADRLFHALQAGDKSGGDSRGKQSACLLVVKPNGGYGGTTDRYLDLRVDDHTDPIIELYRLLQLHHLFLGRSRPEEKVFLDSSLISELKDIMSKLGYYSGIVNGEWDDVTRNSLWHFFDMENLEQRIDLENSLIDAPALEYIRNRFS